MSILVTFMAWFTRLVCIGASIRGAEYKGNTIDLLCQHLYVVLNTGPSITVRSES